MMSGLAPKSIDSYSLRLRRESDYLNLDGTLRFEVPPERQQFYRARRIEVALDAFDTEQVFFLLAKWLQ